MKALAEQIGDIDGVNIYGRVVGVRGLMVEIAGPIHAMSVGARIVIETGGSRFIPAEVIGFTGEQCRGDAVRRPRRGAARLPRRDRQCRRPGAAVSRHGSAASSTRMGEPIDGKGPLPQGPSPMPVSQLAAAGAFAQAGRHAARSRRPLPEYLPDLLPRPAARHFRRLRRRQIGAAVDAGAQCRCRHHGDRAGRRTRPRGAGVLAGRPRRRGPGAIGGRGGDLRRARLDAAAGGLSDAGDLRNTSATRART